jgi:TRAP-type C4-dicarboxylate transport system permease small subunit
MKSSKGKFVKGVECAYAIGAVIAGVLLFWIALSVSIDVFARYIFRNPIIWTRQSVDYSIVIATFLGSPWVLRRGGHVIVDIVTAHLKPKARLIAKLCASILGAFVCLTFACVGTKVTWEHFIRGIMDVEAIYVPKFPFLAIITVGFLLMFLSFAMDIKRIYEELRTGEIPEEEFEVKEVGF